MEEITDKETLDRIHEECMLTRDGRAYVGDTVIDHSHKDEQVKIIGFFHGEYHLMVAFDRGNPIAAKGGNAWRNYTIDQPRTPTKGGAS